MSAIIIAPVPKDPTNSSGRLHSVGNEKRPQTESLSGNFMSFIEEFSIMHRPLLHLEEYVGLVNGEFNGGGGIYCSFIHEKFELNYSFTEKEKKQIQFIRLRKK